MDWAPQGALRPHVARKLAEARELENHAALELRLSYMAPPPAHTVRRALKALPLSSLSSSLPSQQRRLAVVPDLKRFSASRKRRSGTEAPAAAAAAAASFHTEPLGLLADRYSTFAASGCEAAIVSADHMLYGGRTQDVRSVVQFWRHNEGDDKHQGGGGGGGSEEQLDAGGAYSASASPSTVIQKDLFVHPLQLAQAAELGVGAVLLVASACLPHLEELQNTAYLLGLETLVEVHTEDELGYALDSGAGALLLSSVDRANERLVPGRAEALLSQCSEAALGQLGVVCLGGGGIRTADDARRMRDAGADGVVVGAALMELGDDTTRALQLVAEMAHV